MVEIVIDNSYSQIKGLKSTEFAKLRKLLSYTQDPAAAYFSRGFARRYYLLDKKGFFPSGLISKVTGFLSHQHIYNVTTKHASTLPKSHKNIFQLNLSSVQPYKWQIHAAEQAMRNGRGGIVAPTGSGKSLLIALIASRLNVKTLVVVPTLEIKKQLQGSLIALFGQNKYIRIENIDSKALNSLTGFDCLILDECHHAAAKTYQRLNKTVWKGIYYRFFLTATFFRNQENEQLLFEGIAGDVIYELTYKQAVKDGIIVPVEAYYVELPKTHVFGHTWAEVYKELVTHDKDRNDLISHLLKTLSKVNKSTLCLIKEIAHGKNLNGAPFVNGQDEESRDAITLFNRREIPVLIGTTGILGEGVDTKPAEYIIIAGLGKAKSAFMQQIGRGVRKYPGKESCKIIIFKDGSHKWTKSHFNAQKKILLEEYGVVPVKLDL